MLICAFEQILLDTTPNIVSSFNEVRNRNTRNTKYEINMTKGLDLISGYFLHFSYIFFTEGCSTQRLKRLIRAKSIRAAPSMGRLRYIKAAPKLDPLPGPVS